MKWAYYTLTLLCFQLFCSLLTGYSAVKPHIRNEFNFDEKFFGTAELLSMLGRLVASIILVLIPSERINQAYFQCGVAQVASIAIMAGGHIFPSLAGFLFMTGMIIFGLARGVGLFPYLLLYEHFNKAEDSSALNIWFGGLNFGAFYGYALQYIFLDMMNLHWTTGFLIQTAIFFLSVLLMRVFVPEKFRERQNVTPLEKVKSSYAILKQHYKRKPSNVWLCIDFNFQENTNFELFFWAQYYFVMIGFGEKATNVSLTIPIATFLGSLVLNPILGRCPRKKKLFTIFCTFMMVLSSIIMTIIPANLSGLELYMVMLSSVTFFGVLPFTKSITDQVLERAASDQENYIVTNFMRSVRELFTGFMLLLTGYLMNFDPKNFLYLFAVHAIIMFGVHVCRRVIECRQVLNANPQQNERLETEGNLKGIN